MYSFLNLSVEIFICLQVLFLLVIGVCLNEYILQLKYKYNVITLISLYSILVVFYAILILFNTFHYEAILLNYQIIMDNFTFFFKFIILFMSCIILILSLDYNQYERIKAFEYSLLLLLSIIGILTIIASFDLITMYLAIELQSLCFYILTNIKFYSNFSIEAGLKYFILGALSSGILLFGMSLLYGFTGLTNFSDLMILFHYYNMGYFDFYYYKIILIGIIFIYCGLLFKIGIVPFHM
jgi:NADH-quinone oxidoreductase subunit N